MIRPAMSSSLLLNLISLVLHLLAFFATGDSDGDVDQFVYSGFAGANITLDGAATVSPDGLVDLSNPGERLIGHVFYPYPLRLRDRKSFSVSFVFAIRRSGWPSHGFVFFVTKTMDFSTALGIQYFGIFNSDNRGNTSNHIFAAEMDTILNSELRDMDANHVGVDINSVISNRSHTAGFYNDNQDGFFNTLNLTSGEGMLVWVDYDSESTRIDVTMSPLGMSKPVRPLISAVYNLSTVLTESSYIGFASGASDARHYILGWSFGINSHAPAIDITKLPRLPRVGPKPRSKVLEIFLPLATAGFVLAVGTIVFLLVRRRRRYAELREDWEVEFGPHRLSYKDLYHATQGFKNKHLLGLGGFGRVYRGVLPRSKTEIAVKRVSLSQHESKQGMKEFIAEVSSLGRLQHRNIVPLLGYCRRKGHLFLVYEYMPNGSLDKYLYDQDHQDGDMPTLSWAERFRIIRGIASGLVYLHKECEKIIVHRDVKASNVLLDGEMNARLGDFGLARLYDHGADQQISTHVVGTIGYLPPELACTRKVTPLTDVFAFGIFILEVVCGRSPVKQDRGDEDQHLLLADWVLGHYHDGSLMATVDAKLHGDYDVNEACLALKLGLLCSHPFMDARPTMHQVMQYLDGGHITSPDELNTNLEMLTMHDVKYI